MHVRNYESTVLFYALSVLKKFERPKPGRYPILITRKCDLIRGECYIPGRVPGPGGKVGAGVGWGTITSLQTD